MPQISRFFGIIIMMYYDDHNPPHFHARYGGQECLIRIDNFQVLEGNLSSRALKMVVEWAEIPLRASLAVATERATKPSCPPGAPAAVSGCKALGAGPGRASGVILRRLPLLGLALDPFSRRVKMTVNADDGSPPTWRSRNNPFRAGKWGIGLRA